MFDLGILNGRLYLDGVFTAGNLYCKDGKVSAVTTARLDCAKTVDAAGKWVLPGFIDPHVHFALTVGENTSGDDFYTGSVAAALGGVTTFIDFIDPVRDVDALHAAYAERRALAAPSAVDYGLHCTVKGLDGDPAAFLNETAALGMPTVKLFTTYSSSGRRTRDRDIAALLTHSKACGARIVVHAENDDLLYEGTDISVADHEHARPALCERTAVLHLCELAKACDGSLYIVHTSAGSTARRVREQYGDLLHKDVILESCPQYFWYDASVYGAADGWRYTMTPPLREKTEQDILRAEFGSIDVLATDHCPFDDALKQRAFVHEIPMGVGGVQYAFPAMFTLFGQAVLPKYTKEPARIEGLFPHKGTLLPGADADVVLFDPDQLWTVKDASSIYDGKALRGKVVSVFSNGRAVVEDGRFVGQKGTGAYLTRRLAAQ